MPREIQERVEDPTVREVDLGRLDLPFRDILMPGLKLEDHQPGGQDVQIVPHRRIGDPERPGELRGIPGLGMIMGQHRPKPAKGDRADVDPELRQVPFQERLDERSAPFIALRGRAGQVRPGESPPKPEALAIFDPDFIEGETFQLMENHAACEGLRSLAEELRRGASQDQEPGGVPGPIGQNAQDLKKAGEPLDLVDDDEPLGLFEREHGIVESRHVLWILQVEVDRWRIHPSHHMAGQGRLPDLPGAHDADNGIPPEQTPDGLDFVQSRDHGLKLP